MRGRGGIGASEPGRAADGDLGQQAVGPGLAPFAAPALGAGRPGLAQNPPQVAQELGNQGFVLLGAALATGALAGSQDALGGPEEQGTAGVHERTRMRNGVKRSHESVRQLPRVKLQMDVGRCEHDASSWLVILSVTLSVRES